jgi:hypothetical protein
MFTFGQPFRIMPNQIGGGGSINTNIAVLMHGDGTNNSTTFIDSSPSPNTFTAFGSAVISTSKSKFGTASMFFGGSTDRIKTPHTSIFDVLSNNFTIELFIYINTLSTGIILNKALSTGYYPYQIYYSSSLSAIVGRGFTDGSLSGGTPALYSIQAGATIAASTWYHVALVRNATTITFYVNGVSQGTASVTGPLYNLTTAPLSIGGYEDNTGVGIQGYIDEFRFINGQAKYTSNFTPTTVPFTIFD